jgi:hypothetical protein
MVHCYSSSSPSGFDDISVRVRVRVRSFGAQERISHINELRSKFESPLRRDN